MKRKSKLLNVVSIIIIIFGSLSVLSSLAVFALSDILEQSYEMLGMEAPSTAYNVLGLIVAVIMLAAGITGVMYRSRKSVLLIGLLYCLAILVNIGASIAYTGFSVTYAVSLILPVLYMWGWYQSE